MYLPFVFVFQLFLFNFSGQSVSDEVSVEKVSDLITVEKKEIMIFINHKSSKFCISKIKVLCLGTVVEAFFSELYRNF